MSDRLRELTALVRAGETGSFSRVARELGVSQPSISRMVADLEARLGVKLLLRTTRHVTPTDAGRVFLERARQILGDLDDAENAARGVDSLRGTLRVALSGAFGIREVIPRLPSFAAQHPKLDDRFHESCHKRGIHLRFWIPTYAACAHKERMESHGSVAAGD